MTTRESAGQIPQLLHLELLGQLLAKVSIQLLGEQSHNLGQAQVINGGRLLGLALGLVARRLHQALAGLVVQAHESLELVGGVLPAANVQRDPSAGAQMGGELAQSLSGARSQVNDADGSSSAGVDTGIQGGEVGHYYDREIKNGDGCQ